MVEIEMLPFTPHISRISQPLIESNMIQYHEYESRKNAHYIIDQQCLQSNACDNPSGMLVDPSKGSMIPPDPTAKLHAISRNMLDPMAISKA